MPGLAFALLVWTRHEVLNNYFKIAIRVARHIIPRSIENQTSLLQGLSVTCWTLRPCPHVSVLVWKRKIFFADCLPVHSYSANTATENGTFRKRSPRWEFLKPPFSYTRVDGWKRNAYIMVWYPTRGLKWRTDVPLLRRFHLDFFQA